MCRILASVVADSANEAHVLLSLREDSLANLDALRAVIPGVLSGPVQLRPLDRMAAEQAIRRPVAKWSEERFGDPKAIGVEPELINTLLDQVEQTIPVEPSADKFVELPLLQLALERLWEEDKPEKVKKTRSAAPDTRETRRCRGNCPAAPRPYSGSPPHSAASVGDSAARTFGNAYRRQARVACRRS